MKSKILKWIPYIGGAVVVAFAIIVIALPNERADGDTPDAASFTHSGIGLPTRLIISKIKVDAAIEHLGLTSGGAMDTPKGPADVAWYSLGTRPGDLGSAVIAGHSGWKDGIPAVFDNLNAVRKGDTIIVVDERGTSVTFVVRAIKTYDPVADASGIFGSNDGKAHLNLITCEGVWDPVTKSSSERLVIFTDKE